LSKHKQRKQQKLKKAKARKKQRRQMYLIKQRQLAKQQLELDSKLEAIEPELVEDKHESTKSKGFNKFNEQRMD